MKTLSCFETKNYALLLPILAILFIFSVSVIPSLAHSFVARCTYWSLDNDSQSVYCMEPIEMKYAKTYVLTLRRDLHGAHYAGFASYSSKISYNELASKLGTAILSKYHLPLHID